LSVIFAAASLLLTALVGRLLIAGGIYWVFRGSVSTGSNLYREGIDVTTACRTRIRQVEGYLLVHNENNSEKPEY
jgi:hypothetical protein